MSKAKTLMVSFLGVSLVFALMVTTIPTLANAETLAPSEPGVSLGKPLSDATLKEYYCYGGYYHNGGDDEHHPPVMAISKQLLLLSRTAHQQYRQDH